MIYFLVNNDYHLHLDIELAKQLREFELGLIQIPYSLNTLEKSDLFIKVYNYPNRLVASIKKLLFNPLAIKRIIKKVDAELVPQKDDVLLVHTEMDLLNQHIIKKFYKAGSKIFLLEDGTATVCHYNMLSGKISFKDNFRKFLLKYFYNFDYLKFKKYGVETFPEMNDFIFKGVIVNHGDCIKRDIPLYKLKPIKEPIKFLDPNSVVFFSQAMYLWFLTEEEYILFIDDFLSTSSNFSKFYFKFHPSENDDVKNKIIKIIKERHPNVIVLNEKDIAENIIEKYPVKYAITFNSTAALNLINRGVVPIFINNMFNVIYPNDSYEAFGQFLKSIDCYSPSKLSDIKPGFAAFSIDEKEQKKDSIIDIINN